jgi:CHAT domain-containing protein
LARDHLNLNEIEGLAKGPREGMDIQRHAELEEARSHLAECKPCQSLVQMYEDLQRRLGQLEATSPVPGCVAEAECWRLAAGILPEFEAAELLEHCTHCDACGLLLRQAKQAFLDQESEEEIAYLSNLESAQPGWQQSLAKRLSATQSDRGVSGSITNLVVRWARVFAEGFAWRPRSIPRYAWAYAAAAVVLLGAVGWLVQTRREPSIDRLIASAYAEQRPFELRIADAAHGPVRQQRSGEGSAFAEPADLLRAKYLIKERLATRPNDQAMLVASGKVELLEGRYDEAIRTFGRLLDAQPDSKTLLTDLATAYFQRAVATDRAIDYGQTIELLGQTLAKHPDDPVALFNRAIALQRMYAYDEAIRDWEHYLRVDPGGNWADEARQRLSELKEKMKARDRPAALWQRDPAAATPLLRARARDQSISPESWPPSFDEEYLDLAVSQWLPSLYVSADSSGRQGWLREQNAWDALTATAEVLRAHHSDSWLSDFLRELPDDSAPPSAAEPFVKGLDFLGQAARANASGDPDSAEPLAESAASLFRKAPSNAGYLRAREEMIYSMVRAGKAQACIQAANQQIHQAKLELHPWLHEQAILWEATCQGFAGNLGIAQQQSERALGVAKTTGYSGQYLRSVLFAAGFLRSTDRDWQDTRACLQSFWEESHNPFHGYEFYAELAFLAEEGEQRYLALQLHREALRMIEKTPDLSFLAVAHYQVAVAAMRVQNLPEAETEFKITNEQFARNSASATSRLYRALAEIQWAAVAVEQGHLELAAERLEQARPHLVTLSDTENRFRYYRTLGELQFRRGRLPEAEQALRSAVNIAEIDLSSLRTDTDRLAWERDSGPAYRTLVELYARRSDSALRALEVWEGYRASSLRSPMRSFPARKKLEPANLDTEPDQDFRQRIRAALPALQHQTVISFAHLPSGAAAWEFDDRGVNFRWVTASSDELAARVREFQHFCADPYSDLGKLQQESRSLYDLLLAPFERYLDPARLLVVEPDSMLSDVPWMALVDSHGQYLGSRFTTVISPGLGYWLDLRSPGSISSEKTALVVGMPTIASAVAERFPPLPHADREAQNVASRFQHSQLLSGAKVTSAAIRQELSRSDVFHFAGHAISGVKQSGLVLASLPGAEGSGDQPTLLSTSDLGMTELQRLQLVVLSACPTAETEKGFIGPDTLVRSFLRAGVPHVVASRWPVDSLSTEKIMTEFYSRLLNRLSVGQALQQAASQLRQQPATQHPYYWAAFSSYGR